MAGLVSIALDKVGERTVLIEVQDEVNARDVHLGPMMNVGGKTIKEAGRNLEDALSDISPAIEALRKMAFEVSSPKEVTLEVGLKLTAAAGVVLASAGAEGTIKVTMKWG